MNSTVKVPAPVYNRFSIFEVAAAFGVKAQKVNQILQREIRCTRELSRSDIDIFADWKNTSYVIVSRDHPVALAVKDHAARLALTIGLEDPFMKKTGGRADPYEFDEFDHQKDYVSLSDIAENLASDEFGL